MGILDKVNALFKHLYSSNKFNVVRAYEAFSKVKRKSNILPEPIADSGEIKISRCSNCNGVLGHAEKNIGYSSYKGRKPYDVLNVRRDDNETRYSFTNTPISTCMNYYCSFCHSPSIDTNTHEFMNEFDKLVNRYPLVNVDRIDVTFSPIAVSNCPRCSTSYIFVNKDLELIKDGVVVYVYLNVAIKYCVKCDWFNALNGNDVIIPKDFAVDINTHLKERDMPDGEKTLRLVVRK